MKYFAILICGIVALSSCGNEKKEQTDNKEPEIIWNPSPYTQKGADGHYYHRNDILAPRENSSSNKSHHKETPYERGYEEGYEDAMEMNKHKNK